jgi:hypothetical protein
MDTSSKAAAFSTLKKFDAKNYKSRAYNTKMRQNREQCKGIVDRGPNSPVQGPLGGV